MQGPDPWLKDYIDSKFDGLDSKFSGLERYMDTKFEAIGSHECRIRRIENWRSCLVGMSMVLSFLVCLVFQVAAGVLK